MGKKLSPSEEKLYRRTDEVLHYVWDPIGVAGTPMARNEYYPYLPMVFNLLKDNADAEKIANYLYKVSSEHMGLDGNRARDVRVAKILLNWKENIFETRS